MPVFRTILVAADFSGPSRAAFRAACAMADSEQSRVIVLNVTESTPYQGMGVPVGEMGVPMPLPVESTPEEVEEVRERLRAAYPSTRGVKPERRVCDGRPAEEILRAAKANGADLIVMGTHGRTGLHRLLVGSVAEAVLQRSACPVLTLHAPEDGLPASQSIHVVLHPTDLSERAEAALRVAAGMARDHDAELVILYVAPMAAIYGGTFPGVPIDPEISRLAIEDRLRELGHACGGVSVQCNVREGDAAEEILRVQKEAQADMIVMGTHGRTGMGRLLMGSVAEAVLRRARCPVLTLKVPAAAEESGTPLDVESATAAR